MNTQDQKFAENKETDTVRAVEVSVRLVLVAGLLVWCFEILKPFLSTIVWALIIAAALFPVYHRLLAKFNKSPAVTSALFTVAILFALMTPVLMLSGTLVESARHFAAELEDGSLQVPPPPERVKNWPFVGERAYDIWHLANENLEGALEKFKVQIKDAGRWLLSTAAGAGLGILQFGVAVLLSGVFLAFSDSGGTFARRLGGRMAGPRGEQFANMASSTIRSVAQGVLGVAFIQAMMAGLGFMAMDIPAAGLWTLLVLILATVQLPVGLVLIPSIFYAASISSPAMTAAYAAWMILVSLIDNVLKPLLLGRGAAVPMPVIFLGAIGGFILQGIVGLFVGAVVLSLGYEMFLLWLYLDDEEHLPEVLRDESGENISVP